MALRKAQLMSFDFATGIFVFILIFLLFAGVVGISLFREKQPSLDFETEYIFDNLENNLRFDNLENPGLERDFYAAQRINATKLNNFAYNDFGDDNTDFDQFILGTIGGGHGIGLDSDGYDTCLYFINTTGQKLRMTTYSDVDVYAIGRLGVTGFWNRRCNDEINAGRNPCADNELAVGLFMPVLYDTGNPSTSYIIQMNIVVCKK